jgi:transposase-like protein
MLPGEQSLPEAIVSPDGHVVNRLFSYLCEQSDQALARQLTEDFIALQVHWFISHRQELTCPRCESSNLIRKGWRNRVLISSRGRLNLKVLQSRCKVCGRTFRPFNGWAGIPSSRRFLEELVEKAVTLGAQFSFARSAQTLRLLTGGTISPEGIRRKIADDAKRISLPQPMPRQTVLVDATKIKAGHKERGEPVYLAITAERGPQKHGRPTCVKSLIHLHVGDAAPVKKRLQAVMPDYLVHDGGEGLADCAKNVQRCRWHLTHQLKHYLWQDQVPHDFRPAFQNGLRSILADRKEGPSRYKRFTDNLMAFGFEKTAGHLQGASDEAFSHIKERGFAYIDTSPLEREMRELNRRADIGARWSPKGLGNVLKVLFHRRLNTKSKGLT